jgi:hypothetical protein
MTVRTLRIFGDSMAVAFFALLVGCQPAKTPPTVHAAAGKVIYKGGRPFPGGFITFTSTSQPPKVFDSNIEDDGSFKLAMIFDNQRLMGAVEGHYQVMVSSRFKPPANVDIYVLPNDVVIEPHENVLTIEVDPATAKH